MLAAWAFGVILLAVVIGVVVRLSELEALVRLLRGLRIRWLTAAFLLQSATYICAATVWRLALVRQGYVEPLGALVPMALAMLFTNQAFPSGGVSGSVVVVRALQRRQIPANVVMGAILVGLVTTYHAYLLAVITALIVLWLIHAINAAVLVAAGLFACAAVGVPTALLWYWRDRLSRWRPGAGRMAGVARVLEIVEATPTDLLRDRRLWGRTIVVQLVEVFLDAATLQVMLVALGTPVHPLSTWAAYVMSMAVSRVVPVPLGLGTFEGTLVAMLHLVNVPIEAALAATLLLRGFTMWLPMIPGLWCARRELRAHPSH